jgi:hypothetical protein
MTLLFLSWGGRQIYAACICKYICCGVTIWPPPGRLIRQDTGDHTMDEMAQLEEIWVTVAHASWLQGL